MKIKEIFSEEYSMRSFKKDAKAAGAQAKQDIKTAKDWVKSNTRFGAGSDFNAGLRDTKGLDANYSSGSTNYRARANFDGSTELGVGGGSKRKGTWDVSLGTDNQGKPRAKAGYNLTFEKK